MQTILVIEDDHSIRTTLRYGLEVEGYLVVSASNGADGLSTLAQIKPPSLILLDLEMPVMNGEEFLKAKNEDTALASIPVVVVSAQAGDSRLPGVSDYVKKPFNLDHLLAVIHRHCSPT